MNKDKGGMFVLPDGRNVLVTFMGIVGGALLPKVMGAVADHYDMSRGFIVPLVCFALVALYGYGWPKLSRSDALHGVGVSGGH
jgi:FHS family L-fucose permease-like MFS transporter